MNYVEFTSESGNRYVYDDNTGQIFNIQNRSAEDTIREYESKMGLSVSYSIVNVKPKDVEDYCIHQGRGFRQLILNVTNECNFRCKYCCYSDQYQFTRGYDNKKMTSDVAEKAIDLYFSYLSETRKSNPLLEPFIGFYGGEPLLNFDIIKHVVEYIKSHHGQYKIGYNITTNGYLLNHHISDFLVENNFSILVSIDGDRETHDRNRITIDGEGTFDCVYDNICEFVKRYPDYELISASACFDYETNFFKVEEFFDTSCISLIKYSIIEQNHSTYYNKFTSDDMVVYQKQMKKVWHKILSLAELKQFKSDKFLFRSFGVGFMEMAYHRMVGDYRNLLIPFTGSCVPGEKIMVSSDGKFNICERINDHFPIGDVYSGIDYVAIAKYINEYNRVVGYNCKNCSVKRLCSLCFTKFSKDGHFEYDPVACISFVDSVKRTLRDFVTLLEADPSFADELTVRYYKYIAEKKIGGC